MEGQHRLKVAGSLLALAMVVGAVVAISATRTSGDGKPNDHGSLPSWSIESLKISATSSEDKRKALFAVGRAVKGRKTASLRDRVEPCWTGASTPGAALSPDETIIAYNARNELIELDSSSIPEDDPIEIPTIRFNDLRSGQDTVLAEGACSIAWREDGAIAYSKYEQKEYFNSPDAENFVGHILVRDELSSEPDVWTTSSGRYSVIAWAGTILLAYRESTLHEEPPDIIALEGKGQERVLGSGTLLAVSPDSSKVFLVTGSIATGQVETIEVREVRSGDVVATLPILETTSSGVLRGLILHEGDWSETTVAVAATDVSRSAPVLAFFEVDDSIELVRVLASPIKNIVVFEEAKFGYGDDGVVNVIGVRQDDAAESPTFHRLLACDYEQDSCLVLHSAAAEERLRPVEE